MNTRGTPKIPVVALVQRKGRVIAAPAEYVNARTVGKLIERHVSPKATLMTDEAGVYKTFTDDAGMKHHTGARNTCAATCIQIRRKEFSRS